MAEAEAIQAYISESANLVGLQSQIKECDTVLADMQSLLSRYSIDLGSITGEIRFLQEQSEALNARLENRRSLRSGLLGLITELSISPDLIDEVCQGDIASEGFANSLVELSHKLEFVSNDEEARKSAAYRDVAPELERLRIKSIGRCRDFLLEKIWDLRKPRTNLHIKQTILLRHLEIATFLRQHGGDIYTEVKMAYIDKVGLKIGDLFRSYWASLEKLEQSCITPADYLGASDSSVAGSAGGMLSLFQGGKPLSSSSSSARGGDVYALGDRINVLIQLDVPPLVPHVMESQCRKFPFETLFRSLNALLMDAAAHEYLFCREFWGSSQGSIIFEQLFKPALSFLDGSLSAAVGELSDPIALFLCIRLTREHGLSMARKRNPALDSYFDRLNLLLWPRLKQVLDAQQESLSRYKSSDLSPRLQVMTDRYAHLTASLLSIYSGVSDGILETNLERLRYAVSNQLLQMSRSFGNAGTVFLILNFSHIVTVLRGTLHRPLPMNSSGADKGPSGATLGHVGANILRQFEEPLSKATSSYVDKILEDTLPQLVMFVKRSEIVAASYVDGKEIPGFGPLQAAPLARDFTHRWEAVARAMNAQVGKDFGGGLAGRAVLQACFTHLLLLWNRFVELTKKQGPAGSEVVSTAVAMPTIMYKLKEYRVG